MMRCSCIACVSVSLVDGQRNRVSLLSCPKPSRTNYSKVETMEDFDSLTHTAPFKSCPQKPGPTALVQFRIWERGSADLDTLGDKLIGAMKHALNDVIMEYYFLTSSICVVPHQLQEVLPTPALSAPSSPVVTRESVEKRHSLLSRKNSVEISAKSLSTSKTAPSPLQFVKDTFGSSRSRIMSPPADSSTKTFEFSSPVASPTVTSSGSVTEKMSDKHQIIRLYEEGERGCLCPIFIDQMMHWLDYCHSQGTQRPFSPITYTKFRSVHGGVSDSSENNVLGDICPRIFCQDSERRGHYHQYSPSRRPLHSEEKFKESSLDFKQMNKSHASDASFILIGRNVDQWQASIQDMGEDEMADVTMRQTQKDKAFPKQSFQRFAPYLLERNRRESLTDQLPPDSIEMEPIGSTLFIPRQRLLFILLNNKQLTMYTYNWAGDSTGSLTKSTTRLLQWQNARVSLLQSVIAQKMGLFHHSLFYNPSGSKKNPFAGSSTNLDDLIKCTAPPNEKVRRNNSMSTVVTSSYRAFDEVYKDLKPSKPLQHTEFSKMSDIVKQQCFQAQDLRLHDRREIEKLEKLRNLYLMWMQKSTANMPIKEDVLHLLKQASRLLHYCATPLLFDPVWRKKVMKKYEVTQRQLVSSPTEKVRSRHSSGQSVTSLRAMRTNSQEGLKKRPVLTPTDSPVNQQKQPREELWHIDLRHNFLRQYIKYVQSLGFISVTLLPNLHSKGGHKHRSSQEKLTVHEEDHPSTPPPMSSPHPKSSTCYLHKAMPAGILLLELSFREQYFCVEMFVCENTRLGIPVNKHLKLLFVDECERCKDLIHVHSFAHDFHLRCIQSCMQPDQGTQSYFLPQYHLTGFLRDFMQVYPYPPKFSRNSLSEDTVSISNLSTNGSDLYNFMVQNNKLIELKKFEMSPTVDPDIDSDFFFVRSTEYALVSQKTVSINLPPKATSPTMRITLWGW
uniref:KICSTOR complex protein SZT2-like n=1 Tax=Crassostrea virginica TaxID=6565 RepID=A0A8B8CLE8_CRAVI|nr:KICSTOR complex protein SZT2-like [Crassostrea virginica]